MAPLVPLICRKTQGEWVSLLFVGCWQLLLGQMGQSNASLLGFVGSYGLVRTCLGSDYDVMGSPYRYWKATSLLLRAGGGMMSTLDVAPFERSNSNFFSFSSPRQGQQTLRFIELNAPITYTRMVISSLGIFV